MALTERINKHISDYKFINETDYLSAYALAEIYAWETGFGREDVYLFIDDEEDWFDLTNMEDSLKLANIEVESFIIINQNTDGYGDIKIYSKKEVEL